MLTIRSVSQFKKDYNRCVKRGYEIEILKFLFKSMLRQVMTRTIRVNNIKLTDAFEHPKREHVQT
jgi:mRNA-degrading endonuclease YafQ of YafQ-DinJ toxin-antitoxin module